MAGAGRAAFYRLAAESGGVAAAKTGAVTVIQRFGDGLRLNPHYHIIFCDGVFHRDPVSGGLRFHRTCAPNHADLDRIVAKVAAAVEQARRNPRNLDAAAHPALPLGAATPIRPFNPGGGRRSKRSVRRPRRGRPILCVHRDGVDLHANTTVKTTRKAAELERLARYLLRPAVPESRLRLLDDDAVLLTLKAGWSNGTTHLRFRPLGFIARLGAGAAVLM